MGTPEKALETTLAFERAYTALECAHSAADQACNEVWELDGFVDEKYAISTLKKAIASLRSKIEPNCHRD